MVRAPAGNPEWSKSRVSCILVKTLMFSRSVDWLEEERDKIEAKQPENKFIHGLNRVSFAIRFCPSGAEVLTQAIKELKSNRMLLYGDRMLV